MSKTVVITDQGTVLGVRNGLLTLSNGAEEIQSFKPFDVDQFVLMGGVEITNAAITLMLKQGIDCVFLTARGSYKGRLVGRPSKNIILRVAQFRALQDPAIAASIAGAIVAGKVMNQRALLLRAQRTLQSEELGQALTRMRVLARQAKVANDVDLIRSMEGEAAKLYFAYFPRLLKNPAFFFNGRNRRPPRDPINACLSFGYTMLQTVVEQAVSETGFDPYLGALHAPTYGRPSLVLDLMEEFRPVVVDMTTINLVNLHRLSPADFGPPRAPEPFDGFEEDEITQQLMRHAIYLKNGGLKIFIMALFSRLKTRMLYPPLNQRLTLHQIIRRQAYELASVIRGEQDVYKPFTIR